MYVLIKTTFNRSNYTFKTIVCGKSPIRKDIEDKMATESSKYFEKSDEFDCGDTQAIAIFERKVIMFQIVNF